MCNSLDKLLNNVVDPQELSDVDDQRKDYTTHEYSYGISSDPLAQFAFMFSALIHDGKLSCSQQSKQWSQTTSHKHHLPVLKVDHPGVPNACLVREKSPLAALYKDKSVAEQNSVS